MRSWVMMAVVLGVLVAGFAAFMFTQSSPPAVVQNTHFATSMPNAATTQAGDGTLGAGEQPRAQVFDKKTGELSYDFSADHFDPPVNNVMHLVRPNMRFYSHDGQVLTLESVTGDMTMPESAKKGPGLTNMQSQPPSNGILYDVTLGLLETPDDDEPVLTCRVPIVAFDNDTLRLNTIQTTIDGKDVLPDRVPVTVRGRDYDFDGQGLTVRYNQRDRRLEFLEVAHGRRLLIKNPKAFGKLPTGTTTKPAAVPQAAGPLRLDGAPIELASTDTAAAPRLSAQEREQRRQRHEAATRRAAAGRKPVATKPVSTKPAREVVAYQANFQDDVHIKEGDAPVGTADRMLATFVFADKEGAGTTRPATEPQPASAGAPGAAAAKPRNPPLAANAAPPTEATRRARPVTRPLSATPNATPNAGLHSTPPATPSATPAATTSDADDETPARPIEITWTGKLTVVPEKLATSGLLSMADRIVEFFGRPVHLQREGSTIDAAYVWAGVVGDRFKAAHDVNTPRVTLHDAAGNVVTTASIDSDGDTAVLHGDSVAELMMAGQNGAAPQKVVTRWSDVGTLHLVDADNGQKSIDHAEFKGDVDVKSPQLKMKTDLLALGLKAEAGQSQPSLTSVHAAGRVDAAVTGADGGVQTIQSDVLDLGTARQPDGTLAVRTLHAHGGVVAADEKQKLMADDLATTLAPSAGANLTGATAAPTGGLTATPVAAPAATQAAGVLAVENLTATGGVVFTNTDGARAVADTLTLDREAGQQWVTLRGAPARVTDPQSDITGANIRVDTAGTHARIDGPGTLTSRQKPSTQPADEADAKPASPIHMAWTKSLTYDGANDRAQVLGDVHVTTTGGDGTANAATGQTMDVAFVDAPATQPANAPGVGGPTAPPLPTTGPASLSLGGLGGGKKVVKSLTLRDDNDVELSSLLHAPDDATRLVRRTYLYSKTVVVNSNPDGSPGAMTVPGPGRLLYEEIAALTSTTAPTTTRATAPAAKPAKPKPGAATAPSTQPAGGRGTVAMQWSKDLTYDPATLRAVLDGDVVVVRRAAGVPPMTMLAPRLVADVTDPKTDPAGGSQLKRLTADQGATMSNSQVRIETARAVFEPAADRIIATGTPRRPVELYDQGGLSSGSIEEVWWNIRTNQPEKLKNVSMQVNR